METVIGKTGIHYQQYNGTCYHQDTDKEMIMRLEHLRIFQTRCHFHWGDANTGKDWKDIFNIVGHIGRSTGSIKIPILLYNSRSLSGGGILDHCIVKITESRGGRVLYQHPKYH